MPNITIDQLPNANVCDPADLYIVQQGVTVYKITFSSLLDWLTILANNHIDQRIALEANNILNAYNNVSIALTNKANANHTHTPADVGLGNVENIAPEDLPLSNALIAELAKKANITDGVAWTTALPAEW